MLQAQTFDPIELVSSETIAVWFGIGVVAIIAVVYLLGKLAPNAVKNADNDWWLWTDTDDSGDNAGDVD